MQPEAGPPLVTAVIPCLNEEETLGICIQKVQAAFRELGIEGEVVVGDNGSTDRSREIAAELGARVALQPIRGYGAALQAAIEAARGRYIIMADADDSYDWSNLKPYMDELEDGADFVMGNRFKGGVEPGAMPPLHRYLGNPVLSFIARVFYRVPVGDFHCGMRGFTKEAYDRMHLVTPGMEFATEMVVRAKRAGLEIREIPIKLYPDKRSGKPHLRSFRDGWRNLRFILTYAPSYLFFAPGAALGGLGAIVLLALAGGPIRVGGLYMGPHFVAAASLMTLLGFNLISLGVLAKVVIWKEMPVVDDRLVVWLQRKFVLEPWLVAGLVLIVLGLGFNVWLLVRRISQTGPMEDTIHAAFVAGTSITVGVTIIFSSFLLRLLLESSPEVPSEVVIDGQG